MGSITRLVTLNRAEQCAMLDKLMPVAHRYGVQMRCCGDKGLVGYPITKSTLDQPGVNHLDDGRAHWVTLVHGIMGLGCLLRVAAHEWATPLIGSGLLLTARDHSPGMIVNHN